MVTSGSWTLVLPPTSRRELPPNVEIQPGQSGLSETSYAKCEDAKSVSIERLVRRFGAVSPDVLHRISGILRYVLGL